MKIITKADIMLAPKYIAVIDYKADSDVREMFPTFRYETLYKQDILRAMDEAEIKFWDSTVYLIAIAEKTEISTDSGIIYKTILTSRTKGNYHRTDKMHNETPFTVQYFPYLRGRMKIDYCEMLDK